jgi:uncharacterized protein
MEIYNCHIHTFTKDHVPDRFVGPALDALLRYRRTRRPLVFLLRYLNPFTDRDILDRYANFLEIANEDSQEKVFRKVLGYYDSTTRFVVLPMDMRYMSAGEVLKDINFQHEELAGLRDKYPERILLFVAVDPRRPNILEMAKTLVESKGFRGIKIYPPLGYYPFDERLYPVYEYAESNGLPIMTHCSRGGVYDRKEITDDMLTHPITGKRLKKLKPKAFTDYYTDPSNYEEVLRDFPNLKICLAHFG